MLFEDESGATIHQIKWMNSSDADWQYRDIPAGMQIVGLYMSKAGDPEWIQSLGLLVWEPNPNATD